MPGCANGAVPRPDLVGEVVAIQVAAIAADAIEFLSGWWPLMAATSVLAMMPVTRICDVNPSDPGPVTPGMLLADLTAAAIPSAQAPEGTLGWWVWNKALYSVFQRYCQCSDTSLPPPTPIAPVWPTNPPGYPPAPGDQPQLTRIENNQSISADALRTIYNGVLYANTQIGDVFARVGQQIYVQSNNGAFGATGEGSFELFPYQPGATSQIQTVFGAAVHLTTIPPTVKRQGTAVPRLYGVGSLYWDVETRPTYPPNIALRQSIHFEREVFAAPPHIQPYRLHYRLMPGVIADIRQLAWSPDGAAIIAGMPANDSFLQLDHLQMPPGWQDSPFYPLPAPARADAGGAAPP